eukprot:12675776-Heterocapsa_arctica.AAC.1
MLSARVGYAYRRARRDHHEGCEAALNLFAQGLCELGKEFRPSPRLAAVDNLARARGEIQQFTLLLAALARPSDEDTRAITNDCVDLDLARAAESLDRGGRAKSFEDWED